METRVVPAAVAPVAPRGWRALVALLRPRQWIKNAFVLAPLVFASAFTRPGALEAAALGLVLFCAASSAVYILNDMRDAPRDRQHPTKRHTRPLAAGTVSLRQAAWLLGAAVALAGAGAVALPALAPALAAYVVLNVAYSLGLKHMPVVDLFCIATGFVLRVWGGALAVGVPLSSWMANTTLCLALYLAATKRRQELALTDGEGRLVLGSYSLPLLERFAQLSATAAIVFYGLFTATVRPELTLTMGLVIFGFFRYQYLVEQRASGENPTEVVWRDGPLAATVAGWGLVAIWIMAR
ncbi:MAG: decaprenyl-phosphate phosphoribosyltransferase [Candidatus Sericytochromatia bacterium]|nr:decaprenyl-phosphate phosphoribosyltransferase [Candidatus Sericytochromatia bacterium]